MSYPEDILRRAIRPARYTGGEWNSVIKDWGGTTLKVALSYPDVYEVAASNMAIPILYGLLNHHEDVVAERVYAPWLDMQDMMREADIPLVSLESGRPIKDFDAVGFSLGYELTYTNMLSILDLARIPLLAAHRDDSHPVIIAGGSGALNPEPTSRFVDIFVIGDGEAVLPELIDLLKDWKAGRGGRKELFRQAAGIEGIYVPSLYEAEYGSDGCFKALNPTSPQAPPVIKRRLVSQLPPPPISPVVPFIEVIHNRGAVEIQRGCSRGCRFCQAGNIYRPVRERPQEEVAAAVGEIIANCGYNEVSLVSLNTSDYPHIDELIADLFARYKQHNLNLSLPSLCIDSFSVRLMDSLPRGKKTGLTFAPEAGSERLRRAINKNIPDEEIMNTMSTAFARGWNSIKLYFMLGLPTETEADVEAILHLVERIEALGKETYKKRPRFRISLSTFIPKPHTPFQWAAQQREEELWPKYELLKTAFRRRGVKMWWNDPQVSLLEAAISRGDRRTGGVIHRAWEAGARFDSWSEEFRFELWQDAFKAEGLEPAFYAHRERPEDEPLPWGHIDVGVSSDFLKQEYRRALAGEATPDCRQGSCNACGLERWQESCKKSAEKA